MRADTKLSSTCTAFAMQTAHSIRDVKHVSNPQVNRARTELVRLINLAHVLVCISADGQNKAFAQRKATWCAPMPPNLAALVMYVP